MLKKFFKRFKSQKGLNGVFVALLLVIVGVGLVAGINTWLKTQKNTIETSAATAINTATTSAMKP